MLNLPIDDESEGGLKCSTVWICQYNSVYFNNASDLRFVESCAETPSYIRTTIMHAMALPNNRFILGRKMSGSLLKNIKIDVVYL